MQLIIVNENRLLLHLITNIKWLESERDEKKNKLKKIVVIMLV